MTFDDEHDWSDGHESRGCLPLLAFAALSAAAYFFVLREFAWWFA